MRIYKRTLAVLLAALMIMCGALAEELPPEELVEVELGTGETALLEEPLEEAEPEALITEDSEAALELPDDEPDDEAGEIIEAEDASRLPSLEPRTICVGESVSLGITVSGTQYKSSNTKVATVGLNTGIVKGVKVGTCTIAARVPGYGDTTCSITVKKAPTKVKLKQTKLSMKVGETSRLTGTVSPSGCYVTLTFTSSNTAVAKVDQNGVVTAVGAGKATVGVKTQNGKTASCAVTVTADCTGVTLSQNTATLKVKGTLTLKATPQPSGVSTTLTWKSSNTSVATVSSSGKVTGKKAGYATITVKTRNGYTDTCDIVVGGAEPTKVTLNKTSATVSVGGTLSLDATVQPAGVYTDLTWASSNSKVAYVDGNGQVTGVKAGTATIGVATSNGKKATCKVTVKAAEKLTVSLSKSTLKVGETATATASLSPVQWSVEGSAVKITSAGKITALRAGEASVWATTKNGTIAGAMITVTEGDADDDGGNAGGEGYIIDISKYQGNVDFDRLAPHVSLVILRATLSMDIDTRFTAYASALNARGIPFGVYCYSKAANATQARAEAQQLYKVARPYGPRFYVMDAEYTTLTQSCISAFATALRNAGAGKIGCYIAHNYYTKFGYANVRDLYDFTWIPRYGKNDGTLANSTRPSYDCDLWQYTSAGTVPGISGKVDMNTITGTGKSLSWFTR